MNLKQLKKRMAAIREELYSLGPMHPGSLNKQYNVCGTRNCRCKDPENPQKHGPYYQLSYTLQGRSSTLFVRQDRLSALQEKVKNHHRFRELVNEWVALSVEQERLERKALK